MTNRAYGYAALLAVIGVSIVFGMVLGGKLNAPRVALAAPVAGDSGATVQFAPAVTGGPVTDFADIVERCLPAVVGVANTQVVRDDDMQQRFREDPFFRWFFGQPDEQDRQRMRERPRTGFGSGFIVSRDGYILTNHHVIEDANRIVVSMHGGKQFDATLVGADPMIDLAVIKIDPGNTELAVLPLGDSKNLRVGQWVIAIGNPLDFDQTVTVGVVSAKERQVPIGGTDFSLAKFIQTDAAINFGNSGGPLLDAAGNVIGINTAISRGNLAEGIGFALPINQARDAMEQLLASGRVERGFLGITLYGTGISETAAEYYGLSDTNGAIVQEVTPGQPADRAGLKRGDVIRKVDGAVVRNNRDLIQKISARRAGEKVELEIIRDGKTMTRTAALIDRKDGIATRRGAAESPAEPEKPAAASGLGVTVENLTPSVRERMELGSDVEGVLVTGVDVTSPLADAGIVPDAVIKSINDKPVRNVSAWNKVVGELAPGAAIKLEVQFGEQSRYVFTRVPQGD